MDHQDPIKTVVDTFLDRYQEREDQTLRKKRRDELKDLEAVLTAAPISDYLSVNEKGASD
jgi:hypothetical protein